MFLANEVLNGVLYKTDVAEDMHITTYHLAYLRVSISIYCNVSNYTYVGRTCSLSYNFVSGVFLSWKEYFHQSQTTFSILIPLSSSSIVIAWISKLYISIDYFFFNPSIHGHHCLAVIRKLSNPCIFVYFYCHYASLVPLDS